jgi:glycerol-3-phosphate dehydrogenase
MVVGVLFLTMESGYNSKVCNPRWRNSLPETYDIIIIGGGVAGCMTARYLSRYQLKILLIEKEEDIGSVTSAANTALIHPGYDPVIGSLKAKLNVAAVPLWPQLAEELHFPYERIGDYVVAVGEEELPKLDSLMKRGIANGVTGMHLLSGDEMRRHEPLINPQVSGALFAETGAMVDPFAVTIAAAENAVMNGVTILRGTGFEDFILEKGRIVGVRTNRGDFGCRWAVNAAGLYSDAVMHKAGIRPEFQITPRKGEYLILDRAEFQLKSVYFPVPSEVSKGILATATVHGNTVLGPTAVDQEDKADKTNTPDGLVEVLAGGKKLVPSVDLRHVIAIFAGLRAAGNAPCETLGVDYNHDFIVEIPDQVQGFVNLGGIESPGLSSSPAIAQRVIELLRDAGEDLKEKADWNPLRPERPRFRHMSQEERQKVIKRDERYGRIVCRCETVTEGEIIAEIHSPVPALSYDAIKRRTWLGTGRCQGGFDMPRVTHILARELGISELKVTKKGKDSEFLNRRTKDVDHG